MPLFRLRRAVLLPVADQGLLGALLRQIRRQHAKDPLRIFVHSLENRIVVSRLESFNALDLLTRR